MKTLFLDCNMGAAGDMLTAALLELYDEPERLLAELNAAGLPGVSVTAEVSVKSGVRGTRMHVIVNGEEEGDGNHHHDHHAGHLSDIEKTIRSLRVSERVKHDALAVYQIIAEAESRVHGEPVGNVHFHEVGALDAVTDIVAACMLLEALSPEQVLASPVQVGSGFVRCAHGLLPVPAPATALILKDVPIYGGEVQGELCTPTGAALLKYFVDSFTTMPVMRVTGVGYGMGAKDFDRLNAVRALLGHTDEESETVIELSCNLDDMTPEAVAFAQQMLLDEGALDAYTVPIVMKKGRPGVLLYCLCRHESAEHMAGVIFKHTTTLGLREHISRRYTLSREVHETQTPYGTVRVKTATGFGVEKSKPEYEDISRIAREKGLSLYEVMNSL